MLDSGFGYNKINLTLGLVFCRIGVDFKYRYKMVTPV